jgi:Holliday junction resolvasome RuvABC DNA-binding subunit
LIAQLEPGNTSTEITLPDSTMELYNLGYSPESITDALYKAACKRQSDAAIKNNKLKLKHTAASAKSS